MGGRLFEDLVMIYNLLFWAHIVSLGYFISASIDMSPASHVGTLGISSTGILLVLVILIRHKV